MRHAAAFSSDPVLRNSLEVGGEYMYRMRGEAHIWTPDAVAMLQHAVRKNSWDTYREYAAQIDSHAAAAHTIRGLFGIKTAEDAGRTAMPLDEVEPAVDIVKRFSTGAISFGAISREAHVTLARAMNAIRWQVEHRRRWRGAGPLRAAGRRFAQPGTLGDQAGGLGAASAVTTEYLVNSDMIQIKVAQGAKPGEGGQLPGHKVDATIAKTRHSTPGVGLISPPPHHDIYSIEDLAQLIYDLKNVNPAADISVKLVSEVGVGTVAAGVAKARADHITIAGFDGGKRALRP